MPPIFVEIVLLIVSYLLGSVPNALIISKLFKGIDIREYGSKNMGATNVLRVLGFKYGLLVFTLDALKASVIIALFKVGIFSVDKFSHFPILLYGFMAVIGHLFPIFANFKGGKGVACSAGIICTYAPLISIPTLLVFLLVALTTKYVSLGSILAVMTAFLGTFIVPTIMNKPLDWILIITVFIIMIIFLISHRTNIKRLLKGEENKTFFIKKKDK